MFLVYIDYGMWVGWGSCGVFVFRGVEIEFWILGMGRF